MNRVYLDNAATTPVSEAVLQNMLPYFRQQYGNASSVYQTGREARRAIDEARRQAAAAINAKPPEVYFTGGGSESDNWAIKGAAFARRQKGRHIITTAIEHHAVLHTCQWLEKQGFEVSYLPVDEHGLVSPQQVEAAITDQPILITIMAASTENLAGIVGRGEAIALAAQAQPANHERLSKLRDKLIAGILERIPDVRLNGHPSLRLPGNVNVSVRYIEGEAMLLRLDMAGIAASSGSACTSGSLDPSHVLLAIGLPHEIAHGSLRFSLSDESRESDVDAVLEKLPGIVQSLREMSPIYPKKEA